MENAIDFLAIIISCISLGFSFLQWLSESSYQKKEATLNAYNQLQDEVFTNLNKMLNQYKGTTTLKVITEQFYRSDDWEKITVYLAKIERFSVGINTKVYSQRVLNKVGGNYFIRIYSELENIIEYKKTLNISDGKHYDEFAKTVKKLKTFRKICNIFM